jgi:hypothetical protein
MKRNLNLSAKCRILNYMQPEKHPAAALKGTSTV